MNDYQDNPGGSYQPYHENREGNSENRRPDSYAPGGGYRPAQNPYGGGEDYRSNPGARSRAPEEPYRYDFSEYQTGGAKPSRKGKKGLVVFFSIVAVVLTLSLVTFAGYGAYVLMGGDQFVGVQGGEAANQPETPLPDAPQLNIASTPQGVASQLDDGLSNEDIAEKVSPSVVRITNFSAESAYGIVGEGSGIIMSKDGYIVTNAHVIEGHTGLQVTLPNDESYNATQVGIDVQTDLAVIKLQSEPMPDLPVAEFGDSSMLRVGERVIAIGNAGGSEFSGSVTSGIISALDRQINTESARLRVIQTDAAINPGNSGGALVNRYGQVVGINSAKFVKEGYEGLGFAIPINNAKPIIDDLLQNGRVTGRPRLGIQGYDVTNVIAQFMGLPSNISGIMVTAVDPDCNIARQGVVPGDVLTSMNGEPIESFNTLKNDLIEYKPGDTVTFEVYRMASQRGQKGKLFTVSVTLDEDSGTTNFPQTEEEQGGNGYGDSYGGDDYNGGYGSYPNYPFFPFY
ncbi:MAG: trypsin-like serine protease [Provencibacterium sp.]|jgi:serine protease Do|nr:trypsin-like serine protease [Provencibacterium sp.]